MEIDDPGIKVRIDDEDLLIQGAGPQEIRLAVGKHRLTASKDSKPVREELVTISRDQKTTVVVRLEPDEPASKPSDVVAFSPLMPYPAAVPRACRIPARSQHAYRYLQERNPSPLQW